MKKILLVLALLLNFGAHAQQAKFDAVTITTHKVADNLYMLEGMGGNIGVSVGEDGVLLVDTQFAPLTQKILDAVKAISDKPVRYVINTHYHGDHTGGNENLGKTGAVIIAHETAYKRLATGGIIKFLRQNNPPAPRAALPVVTFNDKTTVQLNGEEIVAFKIPSAHTDNDAFVHFRKANVVHTGDVFAAYRFPFIDIEAGGSVKGTIGAMDILLKMIDDKTRVIPGHGPISTRQDVLAYRKMLETVGGRVEKMVKEGKNLGDIKAAKPVGEFTEQWGKFRSPDDFVELVYFSYATSPSK